MTSISLLEQVIRWLRDGNEHEAAAVLAECTLDLILVDAGSPIGSERVYVIQDACIGAPRPIHDRLEDNYSQEKDRIEKAVRSLAEANSCIIQDVSWVPKPAAKRTPLEESISEQLRTTGTLQVQKIWDTALKGGGEDPEGAITAARSEGKSHMVIVTEHPWQEGPAELIAHAIEHLHRPTDFDHRIAFLLLDVGVETLFKTYLLLSDEITGTDVSWTRRSQAAKGSFHDLIRSIQDAASHQLGDLDIQHVKYFHDLRNVLYHEGNGITIPVEKARAYADIAVAALRQLLGVDLTPVLTEPRRRQMEFEATQTVKREIVELQAELRRALERLHETLSLALETVDPTLVLPSSIAQMEQWQMERSGLSAIEETRRMLDAYAESDTGTDIETKAFRFTSPKFSEALLVSSLLTMPPALRHFLERYPESPRYAALILSVRSVVELLLTLAQIALGVPDEGAGTYALARYFAFASEDELARLPPDVLGDYMDDNLSDASGASLSDYWRLLQHRIGDYVAAIGQMEQQLASPLPPRQ